MRPLLLLSAVLGLSASQGDPPGGDTGNLTNGPAKEQERHPAPQAQVENAPPEVQLSPPPAAERVQVPPGYIGLANPAFPMPEAAESSLPLGRRYDAKDLAPYFATGKAAEARLQFEQGRYAEARELLAGEGNGLPVRYLRAICALKAGLFEEAAAEMSVLAVDYAVLRDRCLFHAAQAFEEINQFGRAADKYGQVAQASNLHADAQLGLARVQRHLGDLEGALQALLSVSQFLAPAWGRDVGAEALFAMADLHRQAKSPQSERAALIRLWTLHPLSPFSAQVETRLNAATLPVEARIARAEQLIEAHRNRRGRALLEPLAPKLKLPDPLACRAHFAYGKALRKERLHSRAIQILVPVVARCADPDLRARAMYVLGSSRSIVDPARASQTYEALAKEFPSHTFADDALFYAADLYLRNHHPEWGIALLRRVAHEYPDGDFAAEAMFNLFWAHRALGEQQAGIEVLEKIESKYERTADTYEVQRAQYWKARSLEQYGGRAHAIDLLERLADEHPATYYGFLARLRLAQVDPQRAERLLRRLEVRPKPEAMWPMFAGAMGDDPHFLAAVELFRLGFSDSVSSELLAVDRVPLSPAALRLLVAVLSAAGDSKGAHAVARASLRSELSGKIQPSNLFVWQIAYPIPFYESVVRHCQVASVDPYLLQALIREESAFDAKAFSWAGAVGLSQLMLPTARSIARSLRIPSLNQDELLRPEMNVRLGAWYLGALLKRFGGNKALALAAYNAGPGAVAQWPLGDPLDELDAWIEDIPIAETRGYVKRVMRSYNSYKLLYADSQAIETIGWSARP